MVAPGTALREGIDNCVLARTGALIVIGDEDGLAPLLSGGIKLDIEYTPAFLYQLAKMDGAITLTQNATKIMWANVQLTPDPTILSRETGTRHRTAERVSKQTEALVVSISGAPRGRHALRRRRQVRAAGDPRGPRPGEPGPGHPRQVPRPLRPGVDAPDRARVRGRSHAARRAHGAAAVGDGDSHGRRDRAVHRRARDRGASDRDAARGDADRRGRRPVRARQGLHRGSLGGGVLRDDGVAAAPAEPGPARLRAARRADGLRPQAQHARLPGHPRGYRILGRVPRLPERSSERGTRSSGAST